MPEPIKIKCQYCGNIYAANKKNRSHCKRLACRDKEIQHQLIQLQTVLEMLCNNKIESKVEIRLAGNDKISHEAKIESISNVTDNPITIEDEKDYNNGVSSSTLLPYFRVLLWKGVKGNFIISTYSDGTINPSILNQTFTPLSMPMIIGRNMLVYCSGKKRQLFE